MTAVNTAEGAEGSAVSWSSSDAQVASVDEYGNVTAVAAGTATITAVVYAADGTAYTAACEVIVTSDTAQSQETGSGGEETSGLTASEESAAAGLGLNSEEIEESGEAAAGLALNNNSITYTWAIPAEITVIQGGSVAPSAASFAFELFVYSVDPFDVSEYGGTLVSTTVETGNGAGTYAGELNFTGQDDLETQLGDGFDVALLQTGAAGWAIDERMYSVMVWFDSQTGEQLNMEISDPSAQYVLLQANQSLSKISYSCTYTGWYLSFETNGGGSIASVAAADGSVLDLSAYVPARDGYVFGGWYADAALTTPVTSVTISADTTVYALWQAETETETTAQYTLTFKTNGGSRIDPITADKGTEIDLSTYIPTRSGYSFEGWYRNKALTRQVDSVTLNKDKTVYAAWSKDAPNSGSDSGSSDSGTTSETSTGSTAPLTGDNGPARWLFLLVLGALGIVTAAASGVRRHF